MLWYISANNKQVLWCILWGVVSFVIMIRRKNIQKGDVIIACILAGLCMPSSIPMGIFVVPTYLASMSVFKESRHKIVLYHNKKKGNLLFTLLLIIVIGGILAGLNVQSQDMNPSVKLQWVFDALRAGIDEEILFRMFFFAMCVAITKNAELTKVQNVLCYAIMVIPHVLIHFNTTTINAGSVIVLVIFFGLPFAMMQRKHNLVSAIGSHALVDLVRFILFSA